MRGFPVQQSLQQDYSNSYQHDNKDNRPKYSSINFHDHQHNSSFDTLNIPKQTLMSVTAYCKDGQSIISLESILLTIFNVGNIPIKDIKKLKVYKKCEIQGSYTLKVQAEEGEKIMFLVMNQCYHFAYTCFWARLRSLNITVDLEEEFINCCEGEVLKKSQIMKNWEPRYLMITSKDGLMSFRDRKDAPTLVIQSIDQFWTRFQMVEGYKYIVFKLWYSIIKEEFAVPLVRSVKWFKAFYFLLSR